MKKNVFILTLLMVLMIQVVARDNNDDFVLPAKKYGKWGFITKEGIWKIQARFEKAYHFTEGLAAVRFAGKWGYIDHTGSWQIQPRYNQARPFKEGMAGVMHIDKWGYIDRFGQWAIKPEYKALSSFSDGTALVKSVTGYQFIDKNGNRIITNIFRKALPFADGLAFVVYAGHQGYIDQKGNWIIKHHYEEAYSFSEGFALVGKDDQYGFIDKSGSMAIDPKYEDAGFFREGMATVKVGRKWGYINRFGKMIIQPKYESTFPFFNGYAIVRLAGRYGMINRKGDWILNPVYSSLGQYTRSTSLERIIEQRVQQQLMDWQLKKEFEKTEDYHVRTSKNNLEAQIGDLTKTAINHYAKQSVKLDHVELGMYDADMEQFYIRIPGAYPIRLSVPITRAPDVKRHWENVVFKDPVYTINGDLFLIESITAVYNNQKYYYLQKEDLMYEGIPVFQVHTSEVQIEISTIGIEPKKRTPGIPAGLSDVDVQIPHTSLKSEKTFALVIGNEDYSLYQRELKSESNVEYAASDARIFKEYLVKTLGVPIDNISLLINATAGQMRRGLSKMRALAKAYDGEANIIFYYAGHGLPDEGTQMPYLIPVDVNGSDLEYAINLEDAYNILTEYSTKKVTVFLDACFSGGGRNDGLVRSRGIRIKPKSPFVLGNLIVFSATRDGQRAYSYTEKAHGMFTYYVLKGLQVSKGQITYEELADVIHTNVSRKSILINEKEQEPELLISPALESTWKGLKLFETESFSVTRKK